MKNTKIEWTEAVWNPSVGCNKVSAGYKFCYAEVFARRLQAMGIKDYANGFRFTLLPHRLQEPLKITQPTKFFVNSMNDLFHEKMPYSYLDEIFSVLDSLHNTFIKFSPKEKKICFITFTTDLYLEMCG